jgi:hypothetical protein
MAFNGKMELNARIILRDKEWMSVLQDKTYKHGFKMILKRNFFILYD